MSLIKEELKSSPAALQATVTKQGTTILELECSNVSYSDDLTSFQVPVNLLSSVVNLTRVGDTIFTSG